MRAWRGEKGMKERMSGACGEWDVWRGVQVEDRSDQNRVKTAG